MLTLTTMTTTDGTRTAITCPVCGDRLPVRSYVQPAANGNAIRPCSSCGHGIASADVARAVYPAYSGTPASDVELDRRLSRL